MRLCDRFRRRSLPNKSPARDLHVARARRPLGRAYGLLSLLFVLALAGIIFVTVIQASTSVTPYGIGWFLVDGQSDTAFHFQANDSPTQVSSGPDQIGFERQLFTLVNQARIERALPPLKSNDALTRSARGHSRDMGSGARLNAIDATGGTPAQRAQAAGFGPPQFVVEAVGAGFKNPEQLMEALLSNPSASSALLNGDANEIGVGYAFAREDKTYRHYWTIDLGKPSGLVFTVVVNNGAESTTSAQVILHIGGRGWADQMKISNRPDYEGAPWEPYAETRVWTLSEGTGPKRIYVKLRGPGDQEIETIGSVALAAAAKGVKPGVQPEDTQSAPRPPVIRHPAGEVPLYGTIPLAPASGLAVAVGSSAAPGYYQTSEFMFGKVAVGIVMPECNGTIDKCSESWTNAMMDQVYSQIQTGTNWWIKRMNGRLAFVYDQQRRIPTGYEPINHSQSDESLWVGDVMTHLGFSGTTYFEQVYAYNNWMRQKYGTDWAFTIFVANSGNNKNGTFSNGYFAYSYVPGPFTVTTYDNDGYSINNMASVIAHETGHIFGALDQYSGAKVACTATSGYLVLPNQNSQQNCASNQDSIMRGGVTPYVNNLIDTFALGMVGNRVSKGNGLPDPINTTPVVALNPIAATTTNPNLTLSGTAQDQPFASPTGNSITINYITAVKYRVDNGPWQDAKPSDGAATFNKVSQGFTFSPSLAPGTHLVEVQALNRVENASGIVNAMITMASSGPTAAAPQPTPTRVAPTPVAPTAVPPTATPAPPASGTLAGILTLRINAGNTALSLPYNQYSVSSLIASINAQGGSAVQVDAWTGRGWRSYVPGGTGTDFPIQAGTGYIVRAEKASQWTVSSNAGSQPDQIRIDQGWSMLGIPSCKDGSQSCFTASTLAAALNAQGGRVVEIDRWVNGSWSAFQVGYPFDDYAIEVGQSYFIRSDKTSNWSP